MQLNRGWWLPMFQLYTIPRHAEAVNSYNHHRITTKWAIMLTVFLTCEPALNDSSP